MAANRSRTAVLVLGMHRSGTSAVAGAIHFLGAAAPKTPMPGDEFNPRGYWESSRIVAIHDEMLQAMDSSWDDWRQIDSRWLAGDAAAGFVGRLREATIEEFGNSPFFVLKDPRMCRFLPLWVRVLEGLDIAPVAFHVLRNPVEVAGSLKQRDGFVLEDAALQWLRNVLDAELDSRPLPRCFLEYERFLSDWEPLLANAQILTGIEWPRTLVAARRDIAEFLTDSLHRQRAVGADWNADPRLAGWFKEVYAHLQTLCARPGDCGALAALDRVRAEFGDVSRPFGFQIARLRNAETLLQADRAALTTSLKELDAAMAAVRADLLASQAEANTLGQDLHARNLEMDTLRDHIHSQNVSMEGLQVALYQERNRLQEILSSRSWRWTAIVRRLIAAVR